MTVDPEALEEIVEPKLRSGNLQEALELVREVRATGDLTPAAEVAADLAEAHALSNLHGTEAAADVLVRVGKRLSTSPGEFGDELVRLQAGLIAARGFNALIVHDLKRAAPLLEAAVERYGTLELPYRQSGAFINLSIAVMQGSELRRARELLDRAEELLSAPEITPRQRLNNEIAIAINRASLHGLLGESKRAVEVMQAVRPVVVESDDSRMLANLDINLSAFYDRVERFGSALEAARNAVGGYRRGGLEFEARGAEAAVGKALGKLGRTDEAGPLLEGLLRLAEEAGPSPSWLEATIEGLASVWRSTGRGPEADALEARFSSLRAWNREAQLANDLVAEFKSMVDAWADGKEVGARLSDEVVAKLEEVRASESPLGAVLAEFMEHLLKALIEGRSMEPLADGTAATLRDAGFDPNGLNDIMESALAMKARDDRRLLQSSLGELVRKQILASSQEAAEYRHGLLSGRGDDDLLTPMLIAVRHRRFDILFELIEWCRRDLSELGAPVETIGLKPFSRLASESSRAESLGTPTALSVKGGSALRSVNPAVEVIADADELREALAGRHSAWWTMMRFEGHVYWGLLAEGSISGGRAEVTDSLESALEAHRQSLPVVLDTDREVVGADASEWCLRTAAMARAAIAGMIADVDLFEACIRALPAGVANRVLERGSPGAGELMNAYRAMGHALVPDALERYLEGARDRARLIVSIQPELATVPIGLLGTRSGAALLERAPIGFTPPTQAATMVVGREEEGGPCAASLSVVNPSDDFLAVEAPEGEVELRGWGGAVGRAGVATVEGCAEAMRGVAGAGAPTRMSFVGHIRPGVAADPGSAALVLSPGEPGATPTHLSALDLMRAGLSVPDRVYLGGCEGAGFDTGLEWASVSAAMLVQGASCVLAHGWPVVESEMAARVDRACVEALDSTSDVAGALRALQVEWLRRWRRREQSAVPPHYWAGLHAIGRSRPEATVRYA